MRWEKLQTVTLVMSGILFLAIFTAGAVLTWPDDENAFRRGSPIVGVLELLAKVLRGFF